MKKPLTKLQIYARERERERENTPTNLFKKSIFHRWWLRGKIMSNLYVKPWYPVGAILEFDRPMDMTAIYGGTWELFGAGRMTVGIDTGDEDFNKAGKTGGSKDYQKHTHIANMGDAGEHTHAKSFNQPDIYGYAMVTNRTGFGYAINSDTQTAYRIKEAYMSIEKNGNHSHRLTIGDAGTGNSGNMSPYVVVYRYRKVAN